MPLVMSGATLIADYRFNGDLNDSLPGGVALTSHGGTVGAGVYTFGPNQGLSVSNLLANGGDYSIGIRFEFDTTTGYRKLVDFKDRSTDCGQYVNVGLDFYCINSGGSLAANTFYEVVLTRTSAGLYSTYVNGSPLWSTLDGDGDSVFSGSSMYFFMDDLRRTGEVSGGTVDRLLIYDGALTGSEVASLNFAHEPGYAQTPEPATFALAGVTLIAVAAVRRRCS